MKCKKEFGTTQLLTKHENRKKSCYYDRLEILNEQIKLYSDKIKKNDDISIESKEHECKYCKSSFTTKGNIKKHVNKNCSKRNEIITKLNCFQNELDEVKNKIDELENDHIENEDSEDDDSDTDNDDDKYNNLTKEALIEIVKKSNFIIL